MIQITIDEYRELHMRSLRKLEPSFELTEYNTKVIAGLQLYFYGHKDSPYNLQKSIALYGNTGSGKTIVMMSFMQLNNYLRLNPFTVYYCEEIAMEVKYNDGFKRINQWCYKPAFFDDLMGEKKQRLYGNFEDAFEYIFTKRERLKLITHLTMNDKPEDFKKFYGPRLDSRKNTLFNFVLLKSAADYRTLK